MRLGDTKPPHARPTAGVRRRVHPAPLVAADLVFLSLNGWTKGLEGAAPSTAHSCRSARPTASTGERRRRTARGGGGGTRAARREPRELPASCSSLPRPLARPRRAGPMAARGGAAAANRRWRGGLRGKMAAPAPAGWMRRRRSARHAR